MCLRELPGMCVYAKLRAVNSIKISWGWDMSFNAVLARKVRN